LSALFFELDHFENENHYHFGFNKLHKILCKLDKNPFARSVPNFLTITQATYHEVIENGSQ